MYKSIALLYLYPVRSLILQLSNWLFALFHSVPIYIFPAKKQTFEKPFFLIHPIVLHNMPVLQTDFPL